MTYYRNILRVAVIDLAQLVILSEVFIIHSQLNCVHMQDKLHHPESRLIFLGSIVFISVITRHEEKVESR